MLTCKVNVNFLTKLSTRVHQRVVCYIKRRLSDRHRVHKGPLTLSPAHSATNRRHTTNGCDHTVLCKNFTYRCNHL